MSSTHGKVSGDLSISQELGRKYLGLILISLSKSGKTVITATFESRYFARSDLINATQSSMAILIKKFVAVIKTIANKVRPSFEITLRFPLTEQFTTSKREKEMGELSQVYRKNK